MDFTQTRSKAEKTQMTCMKSGEKLDFVAVLKTKERSYHAVEFNIPLTVYTDWDRERDFAWGYVGAGPRRLALNMLMHYTDGDVKFTEKYMFEFIVEFVQPIPDLGGTVKAIDILEWITEARKRDPKATEELWKKYGKQETEKQAIRDFVREEERIKEEAARLKYGHLIPEKSFWEKLWNRVIGYPH